MEVEGYCNTPEMCKSEEIRNDACRGCPCNVIERTEQYLPHLRKIFPRRVKTDG